MSNDAPEIYLIPACSWRRAPWRPGYRSKIGWSVVKKSAIKFCDRQHPLSAFPGHTPRVDSYFMSMDVPETYLTLACSWRWVQQCPGNRFKIGPAVIEQSAIKSWDLQYFLSAFPRPPPRVDSHFMTIDATETFLILACSWCRVQWPPGDSSRIGTAVVEGSATSSGSLRC